MFNLILRHDAFSFDLRSEEHTSELQSRENLVCRLLLEKNRPSAGKIAPVRSCHSSQWRSGRSKRQVLLGGVRPVRPGCRCFFFKYAPPPKLTPSPPPHPSPA